MTITEQYAQKRRATVDLINAHAPERVRQQLVERLRPAIALQATRAEDDGIPSGASKFGGAPDVLEGFEWPRFHGRPLGFFGQLNLEDIAPFDIENALPSKGHLSFFGRFDDESKKDNGEEIKVCYFDSDKLQRINLPDGITRSDCEIIPPHTITFSPDWSTREFFYTELDGIWDYDDYVDHFLPLFGSRKNIHRVLGMPPTIQDPPFIDAEINRSGLEYQGNEEIIEQASQNWRLLLQLDFKTTDYWYGIACFLIHKDDLLTRNWDAVQFEYLGS